MIMLSECQDLDMIKSIITNPVLFRLTYGQGITVEDFEVDTTCRYLVLKQSDVIIGCLQVKEMTKTVIEGHIYILPKFWGTGLSLEAAAAGHNWVKKQGYLKVFTRVPANCIHVLKFLEQIKYRCCGMMEKGIIHNKLLVSLFFYEFEV